MKRQRIIKAETSDRKVVVSIAWENKDVLTKNEISDRFEDFCEDIFKAVNAHFYAAHIEIKK